MRSRPLTLLVTALAVAALAGCGADGAPTPAGSPSESPPDSPAGSSTAVPPRPAPTEAPAVDGDDDGLVVVPQQLNGFAIPGQQVVLLVSWSCADGTSAPEADAAGRGPGPGPCDTAEPEDAADTLGLGEGTGDGLGGTNLPVTVTAGATHAAVSVLEPVLDTAQDVAEVVVVPEPGSAGLAVAVTVTGTGANRTEQETVTFDVVEGTDDRAATAVEVRDLFVPWLAQHRPDLGITATTTWEGTIVSPQWLEVSHYLFFSPEWEMHVEWHVMVAPDDWARVDLRRRFVQTAPSEAFEISSLTEGGEPHPDDVPATVWR